MTSAWRFAGLLAFVLGGCGGDDGDESMEDAANEDAPASDDFAPQDEEAGGSGSTGTTGASSVDGTVDGSAGSSGPGAGTCVEAGQPCGPNDFCNAWTCTCESGFEFMAVGSCEEGLCSGDAATVCDPACANNGGTRMGVPGTCS